jgi:SpoVK/Ycf46/Vps4 family AAA+-type ATPase
VERFDWERAEQDAAVAVPTAHPSEAGRVMTLDDVAGMDAVKSRIDASFLGPLRHPEIAAVFGAAPRGGLLLYGPPGCGKTFLARAMAGELGARFVPISPTDVLDPYFGVTEQRMHEIFEGARRQGPSLVFIDELDALGRRRVRAESMLRQVVSQLLIELDGVGSGSAPVFVLAATNHPWDIDPALLRPGRFDRTVFVPPPDAAGRRAILAASLHGRPTADALPLEPLADSLEGYSGADVAHLGRLAVESAMAASIAAGAIRPVGVEDLRAAAAAVRPSVAQWMAQARDIVTVSNPGGMYDDFIDHLRRPR